MKQMKTLLVVMLVAVVLLRAAGFLLPVLTAAASPLVQPAAPAYSNGDVAPPTCIACAVGPCDCPGC